MTSSYVIIGDGIAGSSAAETITDEEPDADVTVITDEGEPLYNRILIKEHAKGKLPEGPVSMHDEDWYDERDIDLHLNTHVTDVDVDAKTVSTHKGDSYDYDKLLVAAGGTPTQLPVPNADGDGIYHFWTFEDARQIRSLAEESDKGVIVGAGLIGVDLAGVCGAQGLDSHYLMRGQCWWRYALSQEGAEIVHEGLRDIGVEPVFESGVDHFELDDDGHVTAAIDPNGERFECDLAGVGIGLNYNTEFMQGTGLETDGGVVVDEYMQTNLEDVYAAGDITRFYDVYSDSYESNGSWDSAKEQGIVAGHNMVADGESERFELVSTYSVTHFDFPFLSFGHPTEGEEYYERKYSDTEWRRLALKDGKLIGGVLIGDLAPQNAYKKLIRNQVDISDREAAVLAEDVDLDDIAPDL